MKVNWCNVSFFAITVFEDKGMHCCYLRIVLILCCEILCPGHGAYFLLFFFGGVINMAIYWTCFFTHSNCFVSYIITILTCNNVKCSILKIVLFSEQLSKKLIKHRLPSPIWFLSCIIFCKLVICYPIISHAIEKKEVKVK